MVSEKRRITRMLLVSQTKEAEEAKKKARADEEARLAEIRRLHGQSPANG